MALSPSSSLSPPASLSLTPPPSLSLASSPITPSTSTSKSSSTSRTTNATTLGTTGQQEYDNDLEHLDLDKKMDVNDGGEIRMGRLVEIKLRWDPNVHPWFPIPEVDDQ